MLWVWLSLCSEEYNYALRQTILLPRTDNPTLKSIAGLGTVTNDCYDWAAIC